jgi:hypothetical protein
MKKKQQQLKLAGMEIMRALRLLLLLLLLLLLYITVACAEVIFEERFEGTTESIPTVVLCVNFSCWKWFFSNGKKGLSLVQEGDEIQKKYKKKSLCRRRRRRKRYSQ